MNNATDQEMQAQFDALKKALSYEPAPASDGECAQALSATWGPVGYEPGDSTRYVMHLVRVDGIGELGLPGGGYLLTVLNMTGHSFLFGDFVDVYSFDVRGVKVNPWTVKACLSWLASRNIAGLVLAAEGVGL
jgi:hypothetical protein